MASTAAGEAVAAFTLDPAKDDASRRLIARMVQVMYPHAQFGDEPYLRTADAIFAAAAATPAQKVSFVAALHDLAQAGFADLDDAAALGHLRSIEDTPFFGLVRSTTVVTLYDDPDVWAILGYEGPSFDKGGYVNRGFNDLDWLPEPRIEEYEAGR
ncbi:hypothetical protein [Marinivivus vitaminiproducens]|uniref:hypothetical protein n=1 Tax=Marinivivus vitaminiproducens TaxID=3035935 RepID=UPI0027A74B4E|nr:gluconate 2-dehydrogenase subunit 3 family protein [Geminicoccaceae bacterium SCSIO 64248]